MTAIGDFIRRERKARLMTQRELAWNLATSIVNVRAWELGYREPGPESAAKILAWLTRSPRNVDVFALDIAARLRAKRLRSDEERRPAGQSGHP